MLGDESDATDGPRPSGETQSSAAIDLLRLLVGGGLEAGDELRRLIASEPPPPGDTDTSSTSPPLEVRAHRVMVGLLFVAYESALRGLSTSVRVTRGAVGLGSSLLKPIRESTLLAPVRWPFDVGAALGTNLLQRLESIGSREESRSRDIARGAAGLPTDRILQHLQDSPEMQALVLQQARDLLAELPQSPEVDRLVQAQADRYVEHLRQHPVAVQGLVSGQSAGLVEEMMDALRYRAYKLDRVLERVGRMVLRRTPRERLPLPPPEVRHRAEFPNDSW